MGNTLLMGSGRIWTIQFRAGHDHTPYYHQRGAAGAPDWGQGDVSKIEAPSDKQYNRWEQVGLYQASADRATVTLSVHLEEGRSRFMDLLRARCPFDLQIHLGMCEDPRDFDGGWQKIRVFEDALATGYSPNEHGSLGGDGQGEIIEELPISARDIYDILRMAFVVVAADEVGEEVIAVGVCDNITCGECEGVDASDGCQRVFAVTNPADSSPGVLPQVIVTDDQFKTNIVERWVTTVTLGSTVNDAACVGSDLVVVSEDDENLHYANFQDILDSADVWAAVATGFVAGSGPTCMWSYGPLTTYIGGLGGYVYLMETPANGVSVLDAGAATTDDLNDISGYDLENVAAVGDNGAFVYTRDGASFQAGTAPVGPTNLLAVAYRRHKSEIWIGGDDGNLYVTTDYGDHWATVGLPGSGTRVDWIVWASDSVGFVGVRTAAPLGKVLRTINGGYTWYVMPEAANQSLPTADYFNAAAVCEREVNKLFIGGLADNGADGILIKGSDN